MKITVKQIHELCTAQVERYIDRCSDVRFTLDYDDIQNHEENFAMYKNVAECEVGSIWSLVSHDGRAVVVIEYYSTHIIQ